MTASDRRNLNRATVWLAFWLVSFSAESNCRLWRWVLVSPSSLALGTDCSRKWERLWPISVMCPW